MTNTAAPAPIHPAPQRSTPGQDRTTTATPAQTIHRQYQRLTEAGITRMLLGHETGVSVLSVHAELTIWCLNGRITWRHSTERQAPTAIHPATDPDGAAHRILAHLKNDIEEAPGHEVTSDGGEIATTPSLQAVPPAGGEEGARFEDTPARVSGRAEARWPVTSRLFGVLPVPRGDRAVPGSPDYVSEGHELHTARTRPLRAA